MTKNPAFPLICCSDAVRLASWRRSSIKIDGLGPWNTRDHPVMGVVGQTLRIYNDDNVNHRLHTDGVPFQDPAADTVPGTFSDFVLHNVFDLDTNPGLYDHGVGLTARFWISVRPAA